MVASIFIKEVNMITFKFKSDEKSECDALQAVFDDALGKIIQTTDVVSMHDGENSNEFYLVIGDNDSAISQLHNSICEININDINFEIPKSENLNLIDITIKICSFSHATKISFEDTIKKREPNLIVHESSVDIIESHGYDRYEVITGVIPYCNMHELVYVLTDIRSDIDISAGISYLVDGTWHMI